MSIRDQEDNEIIRLPSIYETIFKTALLVVIPFGLLLVSFNVWVVNGIFDHDTRITVLERMAVQILRGQGSGNSNATIITGDASKLAIEQAKAKGYLTTDEFAKVIGKDSRTVLTYIKEGKIQPAPVQDGREWRIAVDSRLQHQVAANSAKSTSDEP